MAVKSYRCFCRAAEAHKTTLNTAILPELEGVSGQYIADFGVGRLSARVRQDNVSEKLWQVSQKIAGVNY